jgi:hypothetical protein
MLERLYYILLNIIVKTYADFSKIADCDNVELDDNETIGKNDNLYRVKPNVTGVIIDKRSKTKKVMITRYKTRVIKTKLTETRQQFVEVEIANSNKYIIYKFFSIIYIKYRKS